MRLYTAAGTSVYVGKALKPNFGSDLSEAYFADQPWVWIGSLDKIGRRDDRPLLLLAMVANELDPGQAVLRQAADTSLAFRFVYDDAPPGGAPSQRFCVGQVVSAEDQAIASATKGLDPIWRFVCQISVRGKIFATFSDRAQCVLN